jgi:Ras GTPase-activating protein 3
MDNFDNFLIDNNDSDVRIEQQLRIKIGEAKNLQPRNGSNGNRDCYCVISLDREQIYRTCNTSEKTLNPFFGEEFQFEIPRRFRNLAIYVYDRERSVNNKDKVIGKVSIKKEDLSKYHAKESWFPILPVDADSEVQGKIHLEIKFDNSLKPGANSSPKIAVRVIDCNDLGVINGCCDPYVVVSLYNGPLRIETKRTKIKKKTVNPRFEEVFNFDVSLLFSNLNKINCCLAF